MALETETDVGTVRANRTGVGRASRRVGDWLASDHVSNLPLDLGLIGALAAALVTREVVLWFHVIFVLLVLAALMLPFKQFVVRLVVWMAITSGLVIWAVTSLDTPSDEITELPLLTLVLILVYLVAQARSRAARQVELAHDELEERTELEQEALHQQLEDAQRREMIGRASAGLAHDLRNVFVVIKGCADDLDTHDVTITARDGAGRVNEHVYSCVSDLGLAADRGLAIIDDLLRLGQRNDEESRSTDLGLAIRQIEPLLRRMVRPGIILRVEIPERSSFVRIDRVGLSQILMNLVANAADAIDGTGNIAVRFPRSVSANGDPAPTTSIMVTDDGTGFTREALERAFETDFTTKTGAHGGYGLPTVWRIVDRCGGSIQIDSSPEAGTTVSLRFATITPTEADEIARAKEPNVDDLGGMLSESTR